MFGSLFTVLYTGHCRSRPQRNLTFLFFLTSHDTPITVPTVLCTVVSSKTLPSKHTPVQCTMCCGFWSLSMHLITPRSCVHVCRCSSRSTVQGSKESLRRQIPAKDIFLIRQILTFLDVRGAAPEKEAAAPAHWRQRSTRPLGAANSEYHVGLSV